MHCRPAGTGNGSNILHNCCPDVCAVALRLLCSEFSAACRPIPSWQCLLQTPATIKFVRMNCQDDVKMRGVSSFASRTSGFRSPPPLFAAIVRVCSGPEAVVSLVSSSMPANTKLAVFDAVTSNTALVLPVQHLVQLCRDRRGMGAVLCWAVLHPCGVPC